MGDSSKVERIIFEISVILQEQGISRKNLLKKLIFNEYNISERTLLRDLDIITKCFKYYSIGIGKNSKIFIENLAIDIIKTTEEEVKAYFICKKILEEFDNIEDVNIFLNFIRKLFISKEKNDMSKIKILTNNLTDIKVDNKIIELIEKAINKNLKIEIVYDSFSSNKIQERIIEPYRLEIYESRFHLFAFCNKRNAIRDFLVSRILDAKITEEKFIVNQILYKNITDKKEFKLINNKKEHIFLEFSIDILRYIKEYHFEKIKIETVEKEYFIGFMETFITPELIRYIMAFGDKVKVIEPFSLRLEIKNIINNLYQKYN